MWFLRGNLLAVLFTITFAFTLTFLVDWSSLLSCTSPETCANAHLFKSNPLAGLSFVRFVFLISFLVTLAFWGLAAAGAFMTIREARDAAFYYQDYLGIPLDSDKVSFSPLQAVSWAEVARRLVRLQNGPSRPEDAALDESWTGQQTWCMLQARISMVEMTNLLMRDSSYALLLQGEESPLLQMIPAWVPLSSHFVASNAVNWIIKTLILPCLLDEHSKQLFPEITTEEFARGFRKRLRLWGLVAFATLVPVLMMSFLFTWLKYTDDFRSARASPLQREWTNVAKYHTREFLELPHLHRSRLNSALLPRGGGSVTETFVNMSWGTTPIEGASRRLIKYVCGSIAGALFALALWDDSPLLHVVFAGKNLLWYLAVSGALVSLVSRSGDDEGRGQTADGASKSALSSGASPQVSPTSNRRGVSSPGRRANSGPHGFSESAAILSSSSPTPLTAWAATMKLLQTIHYLPKMTTSSPPGFTVPTDEFS
ncbi:Autophagy- protein 9A, partial [Perkinsus olseni]